jgi:toxin ParE1/3/4
MAYRVTFSQSAPSDIKEIVRYILTDDRTQAFRFGTFLVRQALSLSEFPDRGRIVPEFDQNFLGEIVVRAYRIVYLVDHRNRSVVICRFWHVGRGTLPLPW